MTLKQNEVIQSVLKEMKGKAYVILFELLNEKEFIEYYQVHYSDRKEHALGFVEWNVKDIEGKSNPEVARSMLYEQRQVFHT